MDAGTGRRPEGLYRIRMVLEWRFTKAIRRASGGNDPKLSVGLHKPLRLIRGDE